MLRLIFQAIIRPLSYELVKHSQLQIRDLTLYKIIILYMVKYWETVQDALVDYMKIRNTIKSMKDKIKKKIKAVEFQYGFSIKESYFKAQVNTARMRSIKVYGGWSFKYQSFYWFPVD
jgi:hypothetical protein